jgi:tetratricopeptide (TPR) repeat protein
LEKEGAPENLPADKSKEGSKKGGHGPTLAGVWALAKWLAVGIIFAAVFTLGNAVVRFIFAFLLVLWALIGPFLLSWCLIELSSRALFEGFYPLSERLCRVAIALDEFIRPLTAMFGMQTSPFALFNQLNLANALMVRGKFSQAQTLLQAALAESEAMPDGRMSLTLMPLVASHLASAVMYCGDFERAEGLFGRAQALKKNRLNQADVPAEEKAGLEVGVAADLFALGALAAKRLNFALAEDYYRQALDKTSGFAGSSHDDGELAGNFLNGMGELKLNQGHIEEAAIAIGAAYDLRSKKFRKNHPIMASSYDNLGRLCTARGDFAGAAKWLALAYKIRASAGCRENLADLGDSVRSQGQLNLAEGNAIAAEETFIQALAMKEKVFGRNYPDVAELLEDLSKLCRKAGRNDEAEAYASEASSIRSRFAIK